MAGYRQIHPKIWKDEWFIELDQDEKLFFIYLFSNDETTFTGLYKLPLRVMANETGFTKERILEMFEKFSTNGKVYFNNGIVWVVNMRKHHPSDSPKVNARIKYDMLSIPECELKTKCLQSLNIIPIPYQYPIDTESLKDVDKIRKDIDKEEDSTTTTLFSQMNAAFYTTLKRPIVYTPKPRDVEALNSMIKGGITLEVYIEGIKELQAKGYKMVSPASVENAAYFARDKRVKVVQEAIPGEEF